MINGSPRKGGNTTRLLDLLEAQLADRAKALGIALDIEKAALSGYTIGQCQGCRACFDKGEECCPLEDDISTVIGKMKTADLIVAASPVYVDDVSGMMKNMIDRLAYMCHRPGLGGKGAYLLTTTGVTPSSHALGTMAMAFRTWGARVLDKNGIVAGALMDKIQMESRFRRKIRRMARFLLKALDSGKAQEPSFTSMLFFRIQKKSWLKNPGNSLDHRYWAEKGWLEKECDYYVPHHAKFLKKGLAKAAGWVTSLFVLK